MSVWDILADLDPVVYFLSFSTLLKYGVQFLWRNVLPKNAVPVGTVSKLFLYPIKSAQGVELEEGECTPISLKSGHALDRHMLVINSEMLGLTAKTVPQLATVKTEVDGTTLHLTAAGLKPISFNWEDVAKRNDNVLQIMMHCQVPHEGKDCGVEVGKWFDQVLGTVGNRLVLRDSSLKLTRSVQKSTNKYVAWTKEAKDEDQVAYQDVTPYMLMSEESMENLNEKLDQPMTWNRFKPNIVVRSTKLYDEDTWKHIYIGEARFTTMQLCGRCALTTSNPETGTQDSVEPLKTLRGYRCVVPSFKDSPCMGICMVLDRPGKIRLGDQVYATRGDFSKPPA